MKKLLIILLSAIILAFPILFAAGCYSPDEGYEAINPGTLPDPIPGKDYATLGMEKYPEPITLTVAAIEFPLEGSVKPGTSPINQSFNKIAEDVLNIKLKYTLTAPVGNFDTKLKLAISANNMPDMFYMTDATLFSSLVRNDQLADLGDSFYYLNDDLREIYLDKMPELLPNCMVEGKLFSFPMASNKYESAQRMYVRKDWLDKLSLSAPKTVEEMTTVGQAFYDNAVQLGLTQTTIIPIAMHKDITWGGTESAAGIFNCFGASPAAYFSDGDGGIYAGATAPEMKTALTAMRDWYSKKILDPQFISKNVDMVSADVSAGKVGMVFGEWFLPEYKLNDTVNNISGADWVAVDLPVYQSGDTAQPIVKRVNLTGYNVVSKGCSNPEAAAKLINLFYNIYYNDNAEEIYGSGVRQENGFFHNFVPIKLWNSLASVDEHKRVQKMFNDGYAAGMTADWAVLSDAEYAALSADDKTTYDAQLAIYNTLRTREKTLHFEKGYPYFYALKSGKTIAQMTAKEKAGWGIYHEMIDADGGYAHVAALTDGTKPVKYDEFFGTPTSQMSAFGEQLGTKAAVAYTAIITGSKPLDYWDTFVKEYKKEGGNSIHKQINAWYDAQWKYS